MSKLRDILILVTTIKNSPRTKRIIVVIWNVRLHLVEPVKRKIIEKKPAPKNQELISANEDSPMIKMLRQRAILRLVKENSQKIILKLYT